MFTQLIADARAAESEHVEEGDEDRLFYKMAVVEEGHRDGRRPVGEPRDRVRPLRRRLRDVRQHRRPGHRADGRRGPARARCPTPRATGPCTRQPTPTPRRTPPGCRRATRSSPSTAPRSTTGHQLQGAIRANGDGKAAIVVERDGERADAHHPHHRQRPALGHRPRGRDAHERRLPRRAAGRRARRPAGSSTPSTQMGDDDRRRPSRRSASCRSRSGTSPRPSSGSRSATPTAR